MEHHSQQSDFTDRRTLSPTTDELLGRWERNRTNYGYSTLSDLPGDPEEDIFPTAGGRIGDFVEWEAQCAILEGDRRPEQGLLPEGGVAGVDRTREANAAWQAYRLGLSEGSDSWWGDHAGPVRGELHRDGEVSCGDGAGVSDSEPSYEPEAPQIFLFGPVSLVGAETPVHPGGVGDGIGHFMGTRRQWENILRSSAVARRSICDAHGRLDEVQPGDSFGSDF